MTSAMEKFRRSIAIEDEGGVAGISGLTMSDCPFDKTTQADDWNSWVFGWSIAENEQRIIEAGEVAFCSTSSFSPIVRFPVEAAVKSGIWKPRYAKITSSSS